MIYSRFHIQQLIFKEEVNEQMSTSYALIPYEDARCFLATLPDDVIEELLERYGINNIPASQLTYGEDKLSILIDTMSDSDLIELGYNYEVCETLDTSVDYVTSFDDVKSFLTQLDEAEITELMNHYNTNDIDDIATAITDGELKLLGFKFANDIIPALAEEVEFNELIPAEHDSDCYDFLEDVPKDIYYKLVNGLNFAVADEVTFNQFKACLDPNLVELCEPVADSDKDYFLFTVVPKEIKAEVEEKISINKTLNTNLFDEDNKLTNEVSTELLEYVDGFINAHEDIPLNIADIQLIGSNAGFTYKPESDIDIHVISEDPIDDDLYKSIIDLYRMYEVEHPLEIGGSAIQLGLEDKFNHALSPQKSKKIFIN